jgi:dTDP-4-amino-4,6-dideoxygalactose transaminase
MTKKLEINVQELSQNYKITKSDLAIFGGSKVRSQPMPPRMACGDTELQAIQELFAHYKSRKVDFGYQDTYERLYTEAFVQYQGVDGYADAVSTGTAALFVAIATLQLPPGSHVIVSPITDPGTLSAIILNQLVPVIADSSPNSYNMGVEQFEERITDKTKAVLVVHAAGKAAPVDLISQVARQRGIYVVEDCSQAHGAQLNGQKVGVFGDIAASSTMYRKALASGGCGGMIFTRSQELYHRATAYADRGKAFWTADFDAKDCTKFLFPALNFNLDEISCALGMKSLEKLEDTIRKRVNFLQILHEQIEQHSKVCQLSPISNDDSPFFHPIFVDSTKISCSKQEFARAIESEGIDINPHYMYVVNEWSWVQPYLADRFRATNAIECRDSSFNILFNENYGIKEAQDISAAIIKVEQAYSIN